MPEGGQPYPEEIIDQVLASDNPTAQGILEALNAGGFGVVQAPPMEEAGALMPPPEEGAEVEMGPPPGAEGGPDSVLLAVRGAMDEDKKRKDQHQQETVV
tara:strand:- start:1041 stop:1340 length:300 start_codon:yes stop_codon:yes gene_type:complete